MVGKNVRAQRWDDLPQSANEFVSPNGKFVISFGPYASSAIRVLDKETREQVKQIEIPRGVLSAPALSPDGKKIAFCLLGGRVDDVSVYLLGRDDLLLDKLK